MSVFTVPFKVKGNSTFHIVNCMSVMADFCITYNEFAVRFSSFQSRGLRRLESLGIALSLPPGSLMSLTVSLIVSRSDRFHKLFGKLILENNSSMMEVMDFIQNLISGGYNLARHELCLLSLRQAQCTDNLWIFKPCRPYQYNHSHNTKHYKQP